MLDSEERKTKSVQVCSAKHEADIFAFCTTDSCYICEKCFERSHRGHAIEYLKFLTRDHLRTAQSLEASVAQTIVSCDQQLQSYSRKRFSDRLSHTVSDFFSALVRALQQAESSVIQSLQSSVGEQLAALDRTHKGIGQLKDQLIVLLGGIKQQVRTYEKEIQGNRYKWFHEHYLRLCEYEDQTNQLRQSAGTLSQSLIQNFPNVEPRLSVREIVQTVQHSFVKSSEPFLSPSVSGPVRNSSSSLLSQSVARTEAEIEANCRSAESVPTRDVKRSLFRVGRPTGALTEQPSERKISPRHGVSVNESYHRTSERGKAKTPDSMRRNPAGSRSVANISAAAAASAEKMHVHIDLSKSKAEHKSATQSRYSSAKPSARTVSPAPVTVPNTRRQPSQAAFVVDSASATLYRLDLPSKRLSSVKLESNKRPLPEGYAAVETRGRILLTGGEINKNIINETTEIETRSGHVHSKAPMAVCRRNHGALVVKGYVYAIGGYNKSDNIISNCERYSLDSGTWEPVPSLKKERNFVSCCAFSGRYLYVFGGSATEAVTGVESYEWIDTDAIDGGWHWQELVKGGRERFDVGYGGGSLQIGDNSILIFGGLNESRYFDYSAIFNVNTGVMVPLGATLKTQDAFYQRAPVVIDQKVYCVGFLTKSLHVFDMQRQQWTVVPLALK